MRGPKGLWRSRWGWACDFLLLFALTAALIWPLWKLDALDSWGSIESTFISDARFLAENLPHPGWQPNWYCGTRFDYIYPPALRYGTALLSRWLEINTFRSYHIYIAFFYCLAIAGVYVFSRTASGSRGVAWITAIGSALISPCYLLLRHYALDVKPYFNLPHRLNVLVRYGEGPHMSAFALLPLALAAAWWGLRRGRPGMLALASILCAALVSNNFYGATALAMLFPLVVWAVWLEERDRYVLVRAAAIGALAYGLTAFWLTPSYLQITMRNLKQVSQPGNRWSVYLTVAVTAAYCVATWWLNRRRARPWLTFVTGAALLMTLNVVGEHVAGFRVLGEPSRLAPELDWALLLLWAGAARALWNLELSFRRRWAVRALAAALVIVPLWPAKRYVRHSWELFPADPAPNERIEHRMTRWITENAPGVRVLATGSLRFWFNGWYDLPQLGGGSEQGLLNELTVPAYYSATSDGEVQETILWMQALGTGLLAVHDPSSAEVYHDFVAPKRYEGVLKSVYADGRGNWIYAIPRRWEAQARVVDATKRQAMGQFTEAKGIDALRAYVEWIERGPDAEPRMNWESTRRVRVQAKIGPEQALVVQQNYDPSWRAYSATGARLAVESDPFGFLLVRAPPGDHDVLLVFETSMENLLGRYITILSIGAVVFLLAAARMRRWPLPPGGVGWVAILALSFYLNLGLFLPGELPYRDSIEGGYASLARNVSAHPNPWGWSPAQYLGLPTQFTYQPIVLYLAAIAARIAPDADFPHAYRVMIVMIAALAPVSVWWFVWYFTRSRWTASLTALSWTLISPSYGIFAAMANDRGLLTTPWRIQVLTKYGEGPHNVGLALIPVTLIAMWAAASGGKKRTFAVASILMAAVTLSNWIAAVSLAWCTLAMLAAASGTEACTGFKARRLLGVSAFAYLLACFWLTPSFLRIVAFNWPKDAYGFKMSAADTGLLAGLVAIPLLGRVAFWNRPRNFYLCFLLICWAGFSLIAAGFYVLHRNVIPESRRYGLEFELFFFLLLFEAIRRLARSRYLAVQAGGLLALAAVVLLGRGQAVDYIRLCVERLRPLPVERTAEFRVARFLAGQNPAGRVFVTGGTRYRLNSWFDLPQLGGSFESGLQNRLPLQYIYQVRTGLDSKPGERGADAVMMLRAVGVEYLAIHGPDSGEYFRDFERPQDIENKIEKVFEDHGDWVYRLPFRGYAHLVHRTETPREPPVGRNVKLLAPFVAAMDDPGRPRLSAQWRDSGTLEIVGPVPEGMLVAVRVNHHEGWRAEQAGATIPIERDAMGLILLKPRPAADSRIELRFRNTAEPKVFGVLSLAAWIAAIALLVRPERKRT